MCCTVRSFVRSFVLSGLYLTGCMYEYVCGVQLFRTGGMGCPPSSEKYRIYWLFGVTCSATMISGTVLQSCSCPLFATLLRNLTHSSIHPWPSHLVFTLLESRPFLLQFPSQTSFTPFQVSPDMPSTRSPSAPSLTCAPTNLHSPAF